MRKNYRLLALFVGLFASISFLRAQEIMIRGEVRDDQVEPLPGVSIVAKGTTRCTVTDIDGNFEIKVPQGATLVFSYAVEL